MPSKSAKKSLGSDQSRDRALNQVGEEILTALGTVAEAARSTLAGGSGISTSALVNPSNLMVGESKPERLMFAQNSELRAQLRLLLTEPFVARVEVDWASEGGRVETFYFPRRSTAGLGPIGGAHFVSSGAALGRLAEYEAGEVAQVPVGKRERKGRILKRTVIDPREHSGLWDAIVSEFEAMPWGDVLELLRQKSLRAYLDRFKGQPSTPPAAEDIVGRLMQEAADAASARERVRRKVVDRIALRDRPILDKFQGEIFRLSLDRQVILFGPPGSGKTTTLIKRLAQKRTPDALAENELELLSGYLRENLARPDSWAMFSPAELLKQYLGDAFNKQGVPDANNVRTWDKERHDLARNVLYILRGDSRGRFQVEANSSLLIQPLGRGIARLHDDFAAYAEAYLLKSCNNAFAILLQSSDESVKRAVLNLRRVFGVNNNELDLRDVLRLLDNAEGLQAEVKRLNDQIVGELKKIANLLLNTHKTLLSEITSALPTIKKADEDEETEEDADETVPVLATPADVRIESVNVLMAALRNWARAIAEGRRTIGGQSGRTIDLIKSRLPADSRFSDIGANIALVAHLRTLIHAPRRFVLRVPTVYARFRREAARGGRHFAAGSATTDFFNRNRISPDEVDVLILVMLRNARRILVSPGAERLEVTTQHDWLEAIKSRYLMQVFVDEATDLSAVQLVCTIELAWISTEANRPNGEIAYRFI